MNNRILVETIMTNKDILKDTWSDEKILEELYKEFPDHQLKVLNGKFKYIPEPLVRKRLDDVLGINWNWEITRESETVFKGKPSIVVTGRLTLNLPSGGKVIREAHGGSAVDNGFRAGDAHKSAGSNALKKAAYLVGVGAYLGLESAEGIDDTTTWGTPASSSSSSTPFPPPSWAAGPPVTPPSFQPASPWIAPSSTGNPPPVPSVTIGDVPKESTTMEGGWASVKPGS